MKALESACRDGDRERAVACRSAGGPIGDALHEAIEGGHRVIVEDLLTSGVDPNGRSRLDGSTPLQTLARRGSRKTSRPIISLLLEYGARMDSGPWTPLHTAAILGRYHSVISLLAAGANPSLQSGLKKETPAHAAAGLGDISILIALIGSSPYTVFGTDNKGNTPLHYAARANQRECIIVLIESGADVEGVDLKSNTPLLSASYGLAIDSATALVEMGANVNARSLHGDTALLVVARKAGTPGAPVLEMVDLLIRAGGDFLLRNTRGESPMDVVGEWVHEADRDLLAISGVKQVLQQAMLDQIWLRRSGSVVVKKMCEEKPDARARVALGRGDIGWKNAMAWLVLESPSVILRMVVTFL